MTKKPKKTSKRAKRASKKSRPTSIPPGHERWLITTPPGMKEWIQQQAEDNGMSRNAFMVLLLRTAQAGWGSQDEQEAVENNAELFDHLAVAIETKIEDVIHRMIEQTPKNVIKKNLGRRG